FESTEYEYKAPFSTKVNSRQTSPSCSKNCRLSIRVGRKLFLHLFHSSSDSDACSSILSFSCSNICHRLYILSSFIKMYMNKEQIKKRISFGREYPLVSTWNVICQLIFDKLNVQLQFNFISDD